MRTITRTARRWKTACLVFVVLLPAIVSFGIMYYQSPSVPYQDDYNAILAFAIDYGHLPDAEARILDIAAAQHNEYKLGFEHAIVASELELTHHLNFRFLTALGNCFLLAIGYLLWRIYSSDGERLDSRLIEFLPVSLLFFALTYWENLDWAMTGLQNTPVIFFCLLAIYLLIPAHGSHATPTSMLAACAAAALAAFTSANGFLLGPVGLLFLLPRREYAKSLMWCASFILPLAAYLYRYTPQAHELSRFFYLKRPLFFFAFFGSAIPSRWAALLFGMAIFAVCSLAIRTRFDRSNPVASYFAIWIVGTACLVAWVRGAAAFEIASRYSMYSVLLLVFCYSFLTQYIPSRWPGFSRRRFLVASLVCAFALWLTSDVRAYKFLGARRRMILAGVEFYRAAPSVNSPMIDPNVEKTFPAEKAFEQVVLTKALREGIYTLPSEQKIR